MSDFLERLERLERSKRKVAPTVNVQEPADIIERKELSREGHSRSFKKRPRAS